MHFLHMCDSVHTWLSLKVNHCVVYDKHIADPPPLSLCVCVCTLQQCTHTSARGMAMVYINSL